MFGLLKMLYVVLREFPRLLNIKRNALHDVPDPTKYLAMVMLSVFWCLAFGIFFGEFYYIGYNMIGHVAIVTMVFVTWFTFKSLNRSHSRGANYLRMPDYSSRCDEYTEEQRLILVKQNNNRNVFNTKELSEEDEMHKYNGA